jgi:hypothetical protein
MSMDFAGRSLPLSTEGLADVCERLGTRAPELWSVLHVETSGRGFLADRRPKILFERHIFSRETQRKFDEQHPDISNKQPGGYGPSGAQQYDRLAAAMALDEDAALRSVSWGIGQIMGFNAKDAGFTDVNAMVTAMVESEDNQLLAIANFLKHSRLDTALRNRDWRAFARGYNGPNFEQNSYDKKLEAAFAQYSILLPDLNVRTAQVFLTYLGFHPGTIDGVMGEATRSAIVQFQQKEGLSATGNVDGITLSRLGTLLA